MTSLTERIYNILVAKSLSIPTIYAGPAASSDSSTAGLLSFFPLPSPGASFADGTSNSLYQFDIYADDFYMAEEYKEELVMALLGLAQRDDDFAMIFTMDSDNGVLFEQDLNLYHYSVVFNIKYIRR